MSQSYTRLHIYLFSAPVRRTVSDFWVYAPVAVIPLSDALLAIMDRGIMPYSGNAIPGISDCRGPEVDGLFILQAIPNTSDAVSKGLGLSKKGTSG